MARPSKFMIGMKVKSIIDSSLTYEVIGVTKNDLEVRYKDVIYICKKKIFKEVEK